jgi:kynurenine formamidase
MRLERIVDLSIVLDRDTQIFPGDPKPRFEVATRIEHEGFNLLGLQIGSQSGTHVDAPFHFIPEGPTLERSDLGLFAGPGVIVDVSDHGERQPITRDDLRPYEDRLGSGVIVALRTGWSDRYLGTDRYYDHPFLTPDACSWLLELSVRTVAIDALNVDQTVLQGQADFSAHHVFLGAGGIFAENLTNLGAVDFDDPVISLLPIRLGGDADGAPCRAAALKLG